MEYYKMANLWIFEKTPTDKDIEHKSDDDVLLCLESIIDNQATCPCHYEAKFRLKIIEAISSNKFSRIYVKASDSLYLMVRYFVTLHGINSEVRRIT